ncbi:MAG: hypothetical protein ACC655_06015 [Rhodothermia bacterium]
MTQLIYAIAALAAVTLFSVSMRHSGVTSEQEMYITEARTRMIGVARETVEQISRMELPFDQQTDADRVNSYQVFPYVSTAGELTPSVSFGGCTSLTTNCFDPDDFDDLTLLDQEAEGLPYDLSVTVTYVDTLTSVESMSQTYAKEVTVTVISPAVQISGEPVSISYSRIFAYPTVFEYARGAESKLNRQLYN